MPPSVIEEGGYPPWRCNQLSTSLTSSLFLGFFAVGLVVEFSHVQRFWAGNAPFFSYSLRLFQENSAMYKFALKVKRFSITNAKVVHLPCLHYRQFLEKGANGFTFWTGNSVQSREKWDHACWEVCSNWRIFKVKVLYTCKGGRKCPQMPFDDLANLLSHECML